MTYVLPSSECVPGQAKPPDGVSAIVLPVAVVVTFGGEAYCPRSTLDSEVEPSGIVVRVVTT